jgi:hypothetical protein
LASAPTTPCGSSRSTSITAVASYTGISRTEMIAVIRVQTVTNPKIFHRFRFTSQNK